MNNSVVITTVAAAREYNGPGTQIVWRPNQSRVSAEPDSDKAVVLHISTEEDVAISARALEREQRKSQLYKQFERD